jgi:hypothetical protein
MAEDELRYLPSVDEEVVLTVVPYVVLAIVPLLLILMAWPLIGHVFALASSITVWPIWYGFKGLRWVYRRVMGRDDDA